MESASNVGTTGNDVSAAADLAPKFDFRLPHLNLNYRNSGSGSVTPEPLATGLFENLEFAIWEDFEKLMDSTINNISDLPEELCKSALEKFESYRKEANTTYGPGSYLSGNPQVKPSPPSPSCYATTTCFHGDDPRRYFDNSTSVDMEGDIFTGVRDILTALYSSQYDFKVPIKRFSLIRVPRTPEARYPIPDRALCTVIMNRVTVPPVCTFEMKGPTVSFANHVVKICRDRIGMISSPPKVREEAAKLFCAGPRCQHEVSAVGLCLYFNHVFGKLGHLCESSASMSKKVIMMISQTLVQVLTSYSGCGFLFMYETGLAFELQKFTDSTLQCDGEQDKRKIIVRTSPMFCCGNQKGTLAAILTLSNYAVKKLIEDKESMNRVAEFSNFIMASADSRESGDMGDTSPSNPSSTQKMDIEPERFAPTGHPRGTTGSSVGNNCGEIVHSVNETDCCSETCSSKNFWLVGKRKNFNTLSDVSDVSDDLEAKSTEKAEHLLNHIYQDKGRMLHSGWSGEVFEAVWEGRKVALKVWNRENEEGFLELRREVQFYELIMRTCPDLLGTAMPNVVLTLNQPDKAGLQIGTVALITEYVGEQLYCDSRGILLVRDEKTIRSVGMQGERSICIAALSSLRDLHRHGIFHGDIALRNLRVESENCATSKWKAWWIDFGESSSGSDSLKSSFVAEAYECALLFENVSDIASSILYPSKKTRRCGDDATERFSNHLPVS